MNKLDRSKKIELLKAIAEGKIDKESLLPARMYVFITKNTEPGVYECEGKKYNEVEYQAYCSKIIARNKNNIIWNEGLVYPTEDRIFTVQVIDDNRNEII